MMAASSAKEASPASPGVSTTRTGGHRAQQPSRAQGLSDLREGPLEGCAEDEVREAVTWTSALARDRRVVAALRAEMRGPVGLCREGAEMWTHATAAERRRLAQGAFSRPPAVPPGAGAG